MVRAIDAGGVVDGVGVETAAGERVFDAPALGHRQVGALAEDLRAHLRGVHPERVVGPVVHLRVGFARSLDEAADAAEPQQIHRCPQHRLDKLGRGHAVLVDSEQRFDLGRELDRLELAIEYAAALGDQRLVVPVPAKVVPVPAEPAVEQALALGPGPGRIGVGVDEQVPVIERAH